MSHLHLESILAAAETSDGQDRGVEDLDGVFARLARESAGIQDVDVLVSALPEAGR
ncbi:hypothetical protein [Streptomyces sp. NPDC056549]|uniref:hypothetical protein n=1 Tax=Streptomyces sp. NPDC056549 TaxID=3345864 RepID=UPI00369DAD37